MGEKGLNVFSFPILEWIFINNYESYFKSTLPFTELDKTRASYQQAESHEIVTQKAERNKERR